ncbi:hypothetical protein OCGS_0941 [Oceaniovalibus guishaninsula JLT2003]|uniref:Calpastatin n=1 Tax=Oceaniovalibus guishaninsula JLT2003 TaxID=1231392 RepID=K2GQF9_9RHOB|nr:DUF1810 domain-containing protein [Oceaniovalibus guishaninsula]EKE44906.1 hypothetical protein OCGS_0941 [Oceaniovalibus guishaninsula JLT2003]
MDDLERFIDAQRATYATALAEIEAGAKRSHWMWYVFPQLRGLGQSEMAYRFGIAGRDEAARYLAHGVLGPRLVRIAEAMLAHDGRDAAAILGPVDALKLRSSMTLFASLPDAPPVFGAVLDTFFDGPDPRTLDLLK